MFGIFGFLGFIFILIICIVLIVLAFLGNIVRSIFGLGRRAPKQYNNERTTSSNANGYSSRQETTATPINKKKIFADDEGEYVEFEEIK